MLDDFFLRALAAGIGVTLVAGPLGCLVVWRRMAFFGDTLAHSALLGVALGLLLQIDLTVAVFAVSACVSVVLVLVQRRASVSTDALLGLLSHTALALGLVAIALLTWVRVDLMGLLFGDILAVSRTDIVVIYVGAAAVLGVLALIWRTLFAATVDHEIALAEGLSPARANIIFVLLLAVVIAIAMKIVGVLLITALLIIPAATARRFAAGPEPMAAIACLAGALAVIAGLFGSLHLDTPSGPSIVVAAVSLFAVSMAIPTPVRDRRGTDGEASP